MAYRSTHVCVVQTIEAGLREAPIYLRRGGARAGFGPSCSETRGVVALCTLCAGQFSAHFLERLYFNTS